MREYLFRGIPNLDQEDLERIGVKLDEGFVYGNLIWNNGNPFIVGNVTEANEDYINIEEWIPVKPETVGESTNTKAINFATKKKEEVFEDDILAFAIRDDLGDIQHYKGVVYLCTGAFWIDCTTDKNKDNEALFGLGNVLSEDENTLIIGNIHNDPKLISM